MNSEFGLYELRLRILKSTLKVQGYGQSGGNLQGLHDMNNDLNLQERLEFD